MNWKTTLSGLVAALLPWAKQVWPKYALLFDAGGSFAVACLGYFAADALARPSV